MTPHESLIRDIIQWDVKSWARALAYWEKNLGAVDTLNGLELGGREGGLSLWLALKGVNMICSDLENTSNTAMPLHKKHGVTHLVRYEDIDATSIPYENYFDLIVFKSILGGVGRKDNTQARQQLFNQVYKALKPGGRLLFAENLAASPMHQKFRERFTGWGYYWHYASANELKQYLSPFSTVDFHTTGFLATLGRNENQKRLLALADQWLFNYTTPASWKYIAYGTAVK